MAMLITGFEPATASKKEGLIRRCSGCASGHFSVERTKSHPGELYQKRRSHLVGNNRKKREKGSSSFDHDLSRKRAYFFQQGELRGKNYIIREHKRSYVPKEIS